MDGDMARADAMERLLKPEPGESGGYGAQARWSGLSPARRKGDAVELRCGTAWALIRIRTLTFAPTNSTTANQSTARTVEAHEEKSSKE
jgi:hypothetical protein